LDLIEKIIKGQASDIEIFAKEILTLRSILNSLYVKHTGQSIEVIGFFSISFFFFYFFFSFSNFDPKKKFFFFFK